MSLIVEARPKAPAAAPEKPRTLARRFVGFLAWFAAPEPLPQAEPVAAAAPRRSFWRWLLAPEPLDLDAPDPTPAPKSFLSRLLERERLD